MLTVVIMMEMVVGKMGKMIVKKKMMIKMVKIKLHLLLETFSNSLFTGIEKGGTDPKSQSNEW